MTHFSKQKQEQTILTGPSWKSNTYTWRTLSECNVPKWINLTITKLAITFIPLKITGGMIVSTHQNYASMLRQIDALNKKIVKELTTELKDFITRKSTRPSSVTCSPKKLTNVTMEIFAVLLTMLKTSKLDFCTYCSQVSLNRLKQNQNHWLTWRTKTLTST